MKQQSLVLAAVLASLGAGGALAQSSNSVELYGIADAYIGSRALYQYTGYDTVKGQFIASKVNQTVVDSGGLNQSRLGIRVKEDLGNGLSAFAHIEQPLNLDAGTSAGAARRAAAWWVCNRQLGGVWPWGGKPRLFMMCTRTLMCKPTTVSAPSAACL